MERLDGSSLSLGEGGVVDEGESSLSSQGKAVLQHGQLS